MIPKPKGWSQWPPEEDVANITPSHLWAAPRFLLQHSQQGSKRTIPVSRLSLFKA